MKSPLLLAGSAHAITITANPTHLHARQNTALLPASPTHTSQCSSAYHALLSAEPTPPPQVAAFFSWGEDLTARGCTPAELYLTAQPGLEAVYSAWRGDVRSWYASGPGHSAAVDVQEVCEEFIEKEGADFARSEASISSSCEAKSRTSGVVDAVTTATNTAATTTSGEGGGAGSPTQTPAESGAAVVAGRRLGWVIAGVALVAVVIIDN